ncbi:MAG: DnaB-like helicase N-terminal domain-containing protein, partial [Candidatus Competibacteraceae bacterium]|nr:DnaB-like helicase N-terminal domain-containing protein [Candidatus Competibacteraceae bacterium]
MQPYAPAMDRRDAETESLKVPPQSLEAEQSVLGGLMLDNSTWDQVADRVIDQDFYRADHRLIFTAIRALAERGQPFDVVTLSEWLQQSGQLEQASGMAYLAALARDTPSAANIQAYADIVRERSVLRQLIAVGTEIANSAYVPRGRDSRTLLDEAEQRVFAIAEQGKRAQQGFVGIKDLLTKAVDRIDTLFQQDNPVTGVPTGWRDFDEMTAGLQRGDLVIVAGRPSMGKCIASGSRLLDPTSGQLRTIDEMVAARDGPLVTVDGHHRLQVGKASCFVDDGIKPVFRVCTALGREIHTTLTHPFLTLGGWRPLAQLRVGERIAVPRRLPYFGPLELSEQHIEALAREIAISTGISHSQLRSCSYPRDGCTARAVELPEPDISPALPERIFRLSRQSLALFLNKLLGFFPVATGKDIGLLISCGGEQISRELQHLLLRFGVNSGVSRQEGFCQLTVGGQDALVFIEQVG